VITIRTSTGVVIDNISCCLVSMSHMRTVLSREPEMMRRPSCEKSREITLSS
jgi:hypothetical protein